MSLEEVFAFGKPNRVPGSASVSRLTGGSGPFNVTVCAAALLYVLIVVLTIF